ncbi:MAG: hypothetical protein MJ057_01225 [Sphaerochaetaceae bacterium]|nr:hypothetical protein [Sphaerochaetaceae bacterium]
MKKVITILAIMMILVSAVFAEVAADAHGAANININVNIGDEFPRFQLATKTGTTAIVSDNVAANAGTPAEATLTDANKALLTQSGKQIEVVFSINQIKNARCFDAYTLTVTATDLVLVKSTDESVKRDLATALTAATDKQKFTVVSGTATHTSSAVADIDYTGTDEDAILIDYQGVLVAAEDVDSKRVEIGTASVKWNSNIDAMSGDYKATVTLTVSAQ